MIVYQDEGGHLQGGLVGSVRQGALVLQHAPSAKKLRVYEVIGWEHNGQNTGLIVTVKIRLLREEPLE